MLEADSMMLQDLGRHITLEGTLNLRDVGGYATADGGETRWRILRRADSLHRLPPHAQEELLSYGVRTIIDLRRDFEVGHWPNVFASSSGVRYVRVDLAPPGGTTEVTDSPLEASYRAILAGRQQEIRRIFQLLAEDDGFPAVIHCTVGKDRTGLIVALLLGLAGVDAETIALDYGLSGNYLGETYFAEARERAALAKIPWEQYQRNLVCPPDYMRRTLPHIDECYGRVVPFLRSAGLTDDELQWVRAALVQEQCLTQTHAH